MGACVGKPKAHDDLGAPVVKAATRTQLAPQPVFARPLCKLRTDARVRDVYKIGRTLGSGGFSVVKLATERVTGKEFAVKIMALPDPGRPVNDYESTQDDIFKEIDILIGLDHPNVIFLKEYFEENNKVYMITELLLGGELLDAVLARGSYNEADARSCAVQLLRGIEYLHSRGIVHRDLKLENLLLAAPDDISCVKIAGALDFGLAKKAVGNTLETVCGTPQYVAPEVIQGTPGLIYGPAVDLWSVGIVLFILLGGYPPFYSENEPALFEQIRSGRYSFDDPVWDLVSDGAKDLVSRLLVTDPEARLTASQALAHPWVVGALDAPANLARAQANMRRAQQAAA